MSYVKVYKYKQQVSYDQGETWEDTGEYAPSGDPIGYYDTLEECMTVYRTIQSGTTCTGTHGVDKHNLDVYEVSYDNGVTWEVVSTSAGTLIEANSPDCGYSARTVSTGYTCVGVDKYELIENQVSYDYGSTWATTATSTGSLIETNSYYCGYRTRTTSGTAYCTGYDKYVDVYSQVSTDYGSTWITTATTPTLLELNSEDCGYLPPFNGKYKLTFNDSSIVTADCDSTSAVTYDEIDAYGNRTGITSVQLGGCVAILDNGAFEHCKSLSRIIIPDSATIIGQYSFFNCSGLTNVALGSGVTTIGDEAFGECVSLASINIPNSVTSIGATAFGDCDSLSSITIPSSVNNIGSFAFAGCYNLSNVVIENGVNNIGTAMFQGCTSISSFTIPDSVTTINGQAFAGCTNLTDISIGSGVTSIGNYAFSGCTALENITISATTPPTLSNYSPFRNTNNSFIIYVPSGSVNAYKAASKWSDYSSRIQAIP